jgi:hypothetical protein
VKNWSKLTAIGGFDPSYIYQKVQESGSIRRNHAARLKPES